jgi:hypothetical protein
MNSDQSRTREREGKTLATYEDRCKSLATALAANVPVILWGPPGVGKTSVVEQIASHHGWHLETVIASISDPTDFKGMPREDAGRTMFSPPGWATAIGEKGGGVVFLDEISTAPPSVQAALLRPVLAKVVGDMALPPATRFVAAANPPEIAADGWDLSAPLANRFVHLQWEVPATVISDGLLFGFSPVEVPDVRDDLVDGHLIEARTLVGAFLRARPVLAHQMPAATADQGVAWPSPRSWATAATLFAHGRAAGVSGVTLQMLVAGAVGAPAAREFLNWRRHLDLPDIEEVLAAGGKIKVPGTPDRVVAVCGSLVAAVRGEPTRERCEAAVNGVLVAVCEAGHVDLATVALRNMASHVKSSRAVLSPKSVAFFADLLQRMGKLKDAA